MKEMLKRLVVEEEGQGMVEYGLITALVVAIAIAVFGVATGDSPTGLGGAIKTVFNNIATSLSSHS